MILVEKYQGAVISRGFDWVNWLDGGTITGSTWTVPTGLIKLSESYAGTKTSVHLSGGTVGQIYEVVNHITATGGNADPDGFDTIHVRVI